MKNFRITRLQKNILAFTGIVLTALGVAVLQDFIFTAGGISIAAAAACLKMTDDIEFNCNIITGPGVKARLILLNFDDMDSFLENVSNPLIIENLTLASGTRAYVVEGRNKSLKPKWTMKKDSFDTPEYTHEINGKAFTWDGAVKQQIDKMGGGNFVAIYENLTKGTDGELAFEIAGLNAGVRMSEATRDAVSKDTKGAIDFILKSDEETPEPRMIRTFFKTDYATTKAIIDGLLEV